MSHFVEGNFKTVKVGGSDIPANSAVKIASGVLVVATAATDKILGTINATAKAGSVIDVHLRSAAGTTCIKTGGAVSEGDAITSNASGLGITTVTAGNQIIGYAVEAAASGAVVEMIPSTAKV